MSQVKASDPVPLEATSPFELRVNLASGIPENAVKEALVTGDMGFLHSFTSGSAVDGPGIRLVAWTAGCQWRCSYCHNPDTWNMMNGIPVTIAKAKERLSLYRHGLKAMSGGLTLSGGEPLMQDRFAVKLFSVAKELDIHTALDTNGYLGERLSDEELEKVDMVLLDLKTFDPERHLYITGKEVGPTHEFARRLGQRKKRIWVRYVLVPGLTDDENDIAKTAQFAAELGTVERVDVLPFHQMGRYKWAKLGLNYTLENTEPPSVELVERTCAQFKAVGLKAY